MFIPIFKIQNFSRQENFVEAEIQIFPFHPIFEGHFPQRPILPGVCLLDASKQLLEKVLEKKLHLKKVSHAKFLAVVNPLENEKLFFFVNLSFQGENITADIQIKNQQTIFSKIKMNLL